jgi:maleate isomerase
VVFAAPAQLPSDQRRIIPGDLFEWGRGNVPRTAEAVMIGGNGFRAVGLIEALEADLDRPVLSANQVLLWAALVTAGADPAMVEGYGRVFTHPAPTGNDQTGSSSTPRAYDPLGSGPGVRGDP